MCAYSMCMRSVYWFDGLQLCSGAIKKREKAIKTDLDYWNKEEISNCTV